MAQVLIFNMTEKAVVISSNGAIVKARSTVTADDSDPVLTSALKSGHVVLKSTPQPSKAEEPKVEVKPKEPAQEVEAPTETPVVEEEAEAPVEKSGETAGEEPEETQEENKSKRPTRPKVAKEN